LIFESKKIEEDGMKRFYAALVLLVFLFAANSVLAAPYAYITQRDSGAVSVYDTVKNKKVTTIAVGGDPFAITMSPDGRKAFVFSYDRTDPPGPGWVSVVDVLTHSVVNTIALPGNGPQGGAVLPNGSKLYVADCGDTPGVTIINTTSNTVEKTIFFDGYSYSCPTGVAPLPDGSKVYVADWNNDMVARIDTFSETVDMTVTVGRLPVGIETNHDGSKVYVINFIGGNISVIDTSNHAVTTISLPYGPLTDLALNPNGTRAYEASWGNDLFVVDTVSTAVSTIDVGPNSYSGGVDITPMEHMLTLQLVT
jgi:YVTN family beta-propeller protein